MKHPRVVTPAAARRSQALRPLGPGFASELLLADAHREAVGTRAAAEVAAEGTRDAANQAAEETREAAQVEAVAIVAAAHVERDRMLEVVRSDAALDRLRRSEVPAATLHSSEISARMFRRAFRGVDPIAVQEWLATVEASHACLEDELERLRWGWDEMLIASARMRAAQVGLRAPAGAAWASMALSMEAARPNAEILAMRPAVARGPFEGPVRSGRRARAALADNAIQLARMRHGAALMQRSNDVLRSQLIDSLTTEIER